MKRRSITTDANHARMLTTREIAARLDITPLTVLGWRRGLVTRPPIPVVYGRVGNVRRVKIVEADLKGYLKTYRPDLYERWMQQQ
jgi:hypothetical protein